MPEEISLSSEVQNFVDIFYLVSQKGENRLYAYDENEGIYVPLDDVELSKLADEFIISENSDMEWSDKSMSLLMKYAKTKAPYYTMMGRRGRIVFNNGTLRLKGMKLYKHSPRDMAICKLPVDYDPHAKCPTFERFISQMANGDANLEKCLYEICGYVAVGGKKACKLVMLVSSGGSGKSVFLKVLEMLVGKEYTSNLSIAEINNNNKAFDRVALLNSRLNVVHELDEKETLNSIFSANVKKIVSGEEISCEHKFGARISFVPNISMIVVASNHCPTFECMPSESIRRRFLMLNITKTFSFAEQAPELFTKLKLELAGIFNKAIEYYGKLAKNNFVFSYDKESTEYIDQQILETHPMYQFVTQHIVANPGHKLSNALLRKKYTQWAEQNDIDVTIDQKSLTRQLANTIQGCHFAFTRGKDNGERNLKGIDFK